MVKPWGTGRPMLVISARLAPLPPSSSRMLALPSEKRYTYFVAIYFIPFFNPGGLSDDTAGTGRTGMSQTSPSRRRPPGAPTGLLFDSRGNIIPICTKYCNCPAGVFHDFFTFMAMLPSVLHPRPGRRPQVKGMAQLAHLSDVVRPSHQGRVGVPPGEDHLAPAARSRQEITSSRGSRPVFTAAQTSSSTSSPQSGCARQSSGPAPPRPDSGPAPPPAPPG